MVEYEGVKLNMKLYLIENAIKASFKCNLIEKRIDAVDFGISFYLIGLIK